jgi:4-hydroxyphenylacetate 3-monooxygenase
VAPSSAEDLRNEEIRPLIDKYYRGSSSNAEERVKLFKLIWDAIGSEFGARHELYEINYSGNHEQVRMDVVKFSERNKLVKQFIEMAETCMADYDLNGWKDNPWQSSQ